MTNPTIHDFDELLARHNARTEILRARHPLNRPALDTTERDSELRTAMAAVGLVFVVLAFAALAGIGALLFIAYGQLRQLLPIAGAAARRAIEHLQPDVAGLVSAALIFIGLGLFAALWPRKEAA